MSAVEKRSGEPGRRARDHRYVELVEACDVLIAAMEVIYGADMDSDVYDAYIEFYDAVRAVAS